MKRRRPLAFPRPSGHIAAVLAAIAGAGSAAAAPAAAAETAFSGANTAWMLVSTVLVLLMTMPGIMLFYSGMLRTRNTLSIMAQTIAGIGVITVLWAVIGYSLAFSSGNAWIGDLRRMMAEGLLGGTATAHPIAPTIPEAVFFLYQMAFAIITFAIILGATAERLRIGASMVFGALWLVLVYAPVAHWVWHPAGWLAQMGHMDFAGGSVVHIQAGAAGLAAAIAVGPRAGFGKQPMVPHNLSLTVLGAGLLWAGWFGFNAGSAYEASARAAGALLATQLAAGTGALCWGVAEMLRRQQMSVLGMATGAIAGLIAVTPASGFVGVGGALAIGAAAGSICFLAVTMFKHVTGIDDSLDVFALHGVGGLVGTLLTPVFALKSIAPVTADVMTNAIGAVAVMGYTGLMTWGILKALDFVAGLRVNAREERLGLDLSQHGESLAVSPQA